MDQSSSFRKAWLADDAPRMVLLQLDGAGPYGDPYQVNSDNNGPYGDAVTQELIPYVEKKFRCIGEPYARVLYGAFDGRLGVAGAPGLLSGLLQRLLVARARPGRFPRVRTHQHLRGRRTHT